MSELREHDVIYLEPLENENPGREWCQDDIWGNGVKYTRYDDWQPIETAEPDTGIPLQMVYEHRDTGRQRVAIDFMRQEIFWDKTEKPILWKHLSKPPLNSIKESG